MNVPQNDIFSLPETADLVRITARLLVAAVLGGCIGFERQQEHKAAA